jgi:hypothetical protein
MKEKKVLIFGIEYKVRKLLNRLNKLKSDHQQVVEESQDLKRIIEEKNILIVSLKEEIQKVKLAKSLEHLEGSNDAKMKINELVRGIDKCIGLLNQ